MGAISAFRSWKARSPRVRILFWPVILTLLCGAIGLAAPLERVILATKQAVRVHPSTGRIVVVEIDERSIRALPQWPSHRAVDAQAIENLFRLGARRVVVDRALSDPSPFGDDHVFAEMLSRHPGRVVLGGRFEEDRLSHRQNAVLPIRDFGTHALIGAFNVWIDPWGYTSRIPYQSKIGGRIYPSFSSILSGRSGSGTFEPDYSIDLRTIPAVSLLDVIRRAPDTSVVAGKDVIIGLAAPTLGDTHHVPLWGAVPGVFVHVIAAETLSRGRPVELGWIPFYLAALMVSLSYTVTRRKRRPLLAIAASVSIIAASIALDEHGVSTEMVPAFLLLIAVAVRTEIAVRRATSATTGLPTLDAARNERRLHAGAVVAIKIRNYADLCASLTGEEERTLLAEITRRLRAPNSGMDLMHVDDSFVWQADMEVTPTLFDHVEGLYALLSLPIEVGRRKVDLDVTFGIDGERDRPIVNRVGSARLSAEDAAAAGTRWRVHDGRALADADFRLSLLSQIDGAIQDGQIWVAYQPKLDLRRRRIDGAEALARWSHPERGPIPPDEFIGAAERANRIDALTYFVLDTAIRDARSLDRLAPSFNMAVNLSVRMLDDPRLTERVMELLRKHDLAPARLTLEITESLPLHAEERAIQTLRQLRDTGVRISIDDYGTKFSTLDYVRRLPATEIKIDQQFIRGVHLNRQDRIMAESTIKLAHDLGLTVVAEGVEEPAAMAELTELGCDVLQGYLIARPGPLDVLTRFLVNLKNAGENSPYAIANQSA